MAVSDGGSVCAAFWVAGKKKTGFARLDSIPRNLWTRMEGTYEFDRNESGKIQIAVPSSYRTT